MKPLSQMLLSIQFESLHSIQPIVCYTWIFMILLPISIQFDLTLAKGFVHACAHFLTYLVWSSDAYLSPIFSNLIYSPLYFMQKFQGWAAFYGNDDIAMRAKNVWSLRRENDVLGSRHALLSLLPLRKNNLKQFYDS